MAFDGTGPVVEADGLDFNKLFTNCLSLRGLRGSAYVDLG